MKVQDDTGGMNRRNDISLSAVMHVVRDVYIRQRATRDMHVARCSVARPRVRLFRFKGDMQRFFYQID